jgi:hypothetical protein
MGATCGAYTHMIDILYMSRYFIKKKCTLERSYSTLIVHDHDLQAILTTFGSVTL